MSFPLDSLVPRTSTLGDLTRIIQVAVGPVVLISGVGLLLLTMTNRMGRIVDRARSLVRELEAAEAIERSRIVAQLAMLSRRARLVRTAVILGAGCVLLVAVLVGLVYLAALFDLSLMHLAGLVFLACMACLIGSMTAFMREIHVSLHALELEVEDATME